MSDENLRNSRRFNLSITWALIIAGLGMASAGGYLLYKLPETPDVESQLVGQIIERCSDNLRASDFNWVKSGQSILVRSESNETPYADLAGATNVILQCDGMTVDKFCMGEECEKQFLNFKLTYEGANQ